MSDLFLSIIIPAHNEEFRLPGSLEKIDNFLRQQEYGYEVIVVENGSHDRTADVVRAWAADHPYVRLMEEDVRGKGIAVRIGMLAAHGAYRFICDADLSMPIEEVSKFLPPALDGYDVAIASREARGAVRYDEPYYRHFIGRGFNLLVKWFAVKGFEDTQAGFKCFTAEAAERIFAVQVFDGMSFDVEALFIAQRIGYRIVEVPINWYFSDESRVRLFSDSLSMLRDILEIRRNWRNGVYDLKEG